VMDNASFYQDTSIEELCVTTVSLLVLERCSPVGSTVFSIRKS
jgi:hypothetical protein